MSSKKEASDAKRRRRGPKWIQDLFSEALDTHHHLMQVTRLSEQGIAMHTARPKLLAALYQFDGDPLYKVQMPDYLNELEKAETDSEIARKEIELDFPILHGWITLSLWSWMENFTKGFVVAWILNRPSILKAAPFQKIKVRFSEFIAMGERERVEYIVDLIDQEHAGALKRGASRFSVLTELVGFPVLIPEKSRKTFLEMQAVRNNIAHRNGTVDKRLRSECPWLRVKIGQKLNISREALIAYSEITAEFLLQLLYEVGDFYGMDLRKTRVIDQK